MSALLGRDFFERDVIVVARDLIGREIAAAQDGGGAVVLRITECEAYLGPQDSAAHSRVRSARTEPMFGPAGHAYVYLCYGIHWLLNLVTGGNGEGTAVLIRSCSVVEGHDVVAARRRARPPRLHAPDLVAGPGKVSQALGVDNRFNRHDVCNVGALELRAGDDDVIAARNLVKGPRVGVDYAKPRDRRALLRFALKGSPAVTSRSTLR